MFGRGGGVRGRSMIRRGGDSSASTGNREENAPKEGETAPLERPQSEGFGKESGSFGGNTGGFPNTPAFGKLGDSVKSGFRDLSKPTGDSNPGGGFGKATGGFARGGGRGGQSDRRNGNGCETSSSGNDGSTFATKGNSTALEQPQGFGQGFGSGSLGQSKGDKFGKGFGDFKVDEFENGEKIGLNFKKGDLKVGEDNEPKAIPFIPENRTIDDIFEEDRSVQEKYQTIFDDDEDIFIENYGETLCLLEKWDDYALDKTLKENIRNCGYIMPRKIQRFTIPLILEGYDMKAQAETGSGKSAAFLIPIIHYLADLGTEGRAKDRANNQPFVLILEPTRELAVQLYEQARKLAHNTGISCCRAYGQFKMLANAEEIMQGCNICVATPGRLKHFLQEGIICPRMLKFFVLDEADRLLSDDFPEELEDMFKIPTFPPVDKRQNLLFSATFNNEVEEMAKKVLKPTALFVHCKTLVAPNHRVGQYFMEVDRYDKKEKAMEVIVQYVEEYRGIHGEDAPHPRILLFVQQKRASDILALYLANKDFVVLSLNGDRPQQCREHALREFRARQTPILVTTDVCARGIDIKDLDFVVNVDLPKDIVTYVHRIGRTGRLQHGKSVSFFDPQDNNDIELAAQLVKLLQGQGRTPPDFLMKHQNDLSSKFAEGFTFQETVPDADEDDYNF
ncbi:unnamed protein product [Bursaphelenchus okinawaensis]|uniref:RNA helicase n=1 Tax=Bursaphelenchus okinawaensis TaxID=465554 RepID=A0A811L959_9BILA|nr:unnamed protein product [Bursaphelenchus okinawaensis]CAG9119552.1 unnamed protein product [Bursaphelenchus okinawaensis]